MKSSSGKKAFRSLTLSLAHYYQLYWYEVFTPMRHLFVIFRRFSFHPLLISRLQYIFPLLFPFIRSLTHKFTNYSLLHLKSLVTIFIQFRRKREKDFDVKTSISLLVRHHVKLVPLPFTLTFSSHFISITFTPIFFSQFSFLPSLLRG